MGHQPASTIHEKLRDLPSVASLVETPALRGAAENVGQAAVTTATREVVQRLREAVQSGQHTEALPALGEIIDQVVLLVEAGKVSAVRPVINATGVLLHTGLGRAPLAAEAVEAAASVAGGYCNVELNLQTGQRTQRSRVVEPLLQQLTGAQAAHIVNNNAGATGLAVAALAAGRELIVSHGELIEIGGGYRLPEVIAAYGATLRPVGTTNKTRASDYDAAIQENTGAILVVHPSNYRISGFASQPSLQDVAAVAEAQGVPLIHDIGSGALIDFAQFGCEGEPNAAESIRAGADIVLFSGDKLVGGPQCGIVVGRRDLVHRVANHPMSRALRVDKITLAALHATLKLYSRSNEDLDAIPLLRFLKTPLGELRQRAEKIAAQVQEHLEPWEVATAHDEAFVGGGSVPQQALPSWAVVLSTTTRHVESLAAALRVGRPPVVGRVKQNRLLLGLHGVPPEQDQQLVHAVIEAARSSE